MIKPRTNTLNLQAEMLNNERRILCFEAGSSFFVFVMEGGRIVRYFVKQYPYTVGDIYVGKVQKILEGVGGAFVEFLPGETGYLPCHKMHKLHVLNRLGDGLKCEDEILVQIHKEPFGEKKPMLSGKIQGVSKELIEEVLGRAKHTLPKTKLYAALSEFEKYIKEYPVRAEDKIYGDTKESADYLASLQGLRDNYTADELLYNDSRISLMELYGIRGKLHSLLSRKVENASGVSIVIDHAEALTAIDVNSAHYDKKRTREEAILEINMEAAKECIYQIQARNITGMILIDFINMKSEEYNNMLLANLQELGEKCSPPLHVIDLTKLGIIECTREKQAENLAFYKETIYKTILTE